MTGQVAAEEVAVKKIPGFVAKGRIRRLECDWFEPEEGAEKLWCDVNVKMSIDELDEFSEVLSSEPSFVDLWPWLTPRVVAWNAMALDKASGEYVAVPPPAEVGESAFRVVDSVITSWLAVALKIAARGGDLSKGLARSESTPEPASADGSDSEPRPAKTRRNRKG